MAKPTWGFPLKDTMIYNRPAIIKKNDKLCSQIVRSRGACERCGKTESLQDAHIIGRAKSLSIRWDFENHLCLCVACHIYWWHKQPLEAADWFNEKWPGRYDKLNQKRQLISKVDVQGMYLWLKKEAAKLDASSDSRD